MKYTQSDLDEIGKIKSFESVQAMESILVDELRKLWNSAYPTSRKEQRKKIINKIEL